MIDWRALRSHIAQRSAAFLQRPMGTALITVMAAVSGLLGSVWTEEIKGAFPFCCWTTFGSFSPFAFGFWASLILTALLYAFRQRAVDAARASTLAEWTARTNELEELIRTVPAPYILQRFSDRYWRAWRVLDDVSRTSGVVEADVEKAIRTVLRFLAQLAYEFDREPPLGRYAANLMLYRPAASLSAAEEEKIRPILKFAADETDISRLRGVLVLQRQLSATHLQHEEPDEKLQEFALPVPDRHRTADNKYRVLRSVHCGNIGAAGSAGDGSEKRSGR